MKGDVLEGRVAWIFGDDFDIDLVIGPQNIKSYDRDFLLSVCMHDYDPRFCMDVEPGDVIVGGRNFGYGHPHYPAMLALRYSGIVGIVAESFSPGFYRGEIYNGVPLVTCPGITAVVERWDRLRVDWVDGRVDVVDRNVQLSAARPPQRVIDTVRAGGRYQLLLSRYATVGREHGVSGPWPAAKISAQT